MNGGSWARLEAEVRRIAAVSEQVFVFTGPLFESPEQQVIGPGRVAVPSHTFKVVLVPNTAHLQGSLADFATTVDEVEQRTGLDFFAALDDSEERRLEAERPPIS